MKIKQILYLMSFCLLLSATTFAQQVQEFTVSGTVVDKDKLSMPGVSVYIKDKPSKGTTTDNDGNFKLKVVYGDKMIFSFIGFKPSEHVAIEPKTDLTVTLLEDNNSLDEVVVVALGNVQRKISSVGAITTVSTKDIQSPSLPSVTCWEAGQPVSFPCRAVASPVRISPISGYVVSVRSEPTAVPLY